MQVERYKVDTITAASLEGNPLGSPADRDLHIYLPPGYYEYPEKKYPVVYFLHGYAGNTRNLTIVPNQRQRMGWLPPEILDEADWHKVCDYQKLDSLISKGELAAFILVQPDGSLYLKDKDGTYDVYTGDIRTKGSFYVNSKHTGQYASYILDDVVNYIDLNYRTLADRKHRGLMGASMGGYGTLSILCQHPEKFSAAAALSPANIALDMLDWKMIIPLQERLLGRAEAEKGGDQLYGDILDTQDIIFSKDRPLIPTVLRDGGGNIVSMDRQAADAWKAHDINVLAENQPGNLRQVALLMNCESSDEFGLAGAAEKLHATFKRLGIPHEYELYDHAQAKTFSPHIFGIAYHIIPAFEFVLGKIA